MEYSVNLNAIWKRLKSPKILLELTNRAKNADNWAAESQHDLSRLSKDMQMVPVYLELATYKGKPRFNKSEINGLTGSLKMYKSEIPVTDLVKQLLNIGTEKGEPLSVREMKDFLSTTALMDENEQLSIIKFIKSLKENTSVRQKDNDANKTKISNDLIQYRSYTSKYYTEKGSVSEFINLRNLEFAYGITRCKKPEILAKIAQITGPHWGVSVIPNELVHLYELSNGNTGLAHDLLRGFYPWEVEKIVSKLSEKGNSVDLSKYIAQTSDQDYIDISTSSLGLSMQRDFMLESLGLTGQIDLSSVEIPRRLKIVDGSFEQGKRR